MANTKCFAYSPDGQRCQQLAGHDGAHAVVKEWSDEESWVPEMTFQFAPAPAADVEHLVEISDEELAAELVDSVASLGPVPMYGVDGKAGTCLLCSHKMHFRDCDRGGCDCRAGVPGG